MKKKYFIFCILCLFLFSCLLSAKCSNKILHNFIFVIDVGHGGKDSGTVYNDILEKDIVLDISSELKNELENYGASVIMIRDDDYDLSSPSANHRKKSDFDNRIKVINDSKADMYFSIHINYLEDSRYSGVQVFYNDSSEGIASSIQSTVNKNLKMSREIKKYNNNYYLYDKLNKPGVLIECGFISNTAERNKLADSKYQKKLSKSIVEGVINYIKKGN